MTTRRKIILAVATTAVGLGIAAAPLVMAHGGGGGGCAMMARHGGHGGELMKVMRELELKDEQVTAIHRIHKATHEKNAEAKKSLHEGLAEAAKILAADPQNIAGARAAVERRQAAIDQLKDGVLTGVSQCLAVLTPEQRAKLAGHIDEHLKELTE